MGAGIQNKVIFSQGQRLETSTAQDVIEMQADANAVSIINYVGSPEGFFAANPSSICHNPSTGDLYKKASGTGNTGWALVPTGGGGGVTNVSGTANRVTSTGGTTPVIDISSSYVGQSSITTLGTVTTGVWNGTTVDYAHGGTGQTAYAAGDLIYASAINTLAKLPVAADGRVLTLSGGLPVWSVPAAGTVTSVSGTTNRVTSTGGATPVIDISSSYVGQSSITTLGTVTTGVWNGTTVDYAHGGTGQTAYAAGDLIYASAINTLAKLPVAADGRVLTLSGGLPVWSVPAAGTVTSVSGTTNRVTSTGGATPVIDISSSYVGQSSITTLGTVTTGVWNGTTVDYAHGGTGQTAYAAGDLIYASAINTLAKLPVAADGRVLTLSGGLPVWSVPAAGTVTSVSGTTNRVTSTGGATPVIDIDAAYVGQSSITTLGTIVTGVWNGTMVDVAHGGSGRATATAFALIAGGTTTTGAHQSIANGATGTVLIGNGTSALPSFSATPTLTSVTFGSGNALSSYVVGTFTPTMVGQTTAGTTTYNAQAGYYTRVGGVVQVQFTVGGTAATGTGIVLLSGLPFTIKNQSNGSPAGVVLSNVAASWTFAASTTSIHCLGAINSTNANIYCSGSAVNGNFLNIANAAFNFQCSLMYQI